MAMLGPTKILYILIGLLMVDALFEMSFVAATVAFLHNRAGRAFQIAYDDGSFSLHGKPAHELADQGHTSNGAAGTALVLVGIGGIVTFTTLRHDLKNRRFRPIARYMLISWSVFSFLSMLLTLAALIYTFVITAQHAGQEIDLEVASELNNRPYPNQVAYPLDSWTPENWFAAVRELELVYANDRAIINTKYHVMVGWRWNLIPLFLLGLAVFVVGLFVTRTRLSVERGTPMFEETKTRDIESTDDSQVETPMLTSMGQIPRKPVASGNVGAAH